MFHPLARTLIPATALFWLSACATTPSAPLPVADAPSGPALWQVSDEDTTIYLFGTVHVLPATTTWFDDRVAKALAASGSIVTELPPSALTDLAAQQTIMALSMRTVTSWPGAWRTERSASYRSPTPCKT